jgi:hypothetical protein
MNILFTTGDTWFSKSIQAVTKEPISHCAIEFPEVGLVLHSDLLGLRLVSREKFDTTHKVLFSLESPEPVMFFHPKVKELLRKFEGQPYDCGAFLFFGLSLLARRYLRIPLPKSNLWQTTGMFLCVGWCSQLIFGVEDDMITPYGLYLKLKKEWTKEPKDAKMPK